MNRAASRRSLVVLAALLALQTAGWAQVETTPEADAWLEKMMGLFDRGPLSVDYSGSFNMTQQDQTLSMAMKGHMTQSDPEHFRVDLSMNMEAPGGGGAMTMNMLTVVDGTTVWIDMDNPMMGGRRVMKMSLEQARKMGGGMGMGALRNMDPIAQLKEMTEKFDFQVDHEGAGEVVLTAPIDPEALKGLGPVGQMVQGQSTGDWAMTLVLDANDGMPKEIRLGGEGGEVMTFGFSGWRFYGAAGAPAETFEYTPPEGVQVMDMDAMAGGGAQPGGGGGP